MSSASIFSVRDMRPSLTTGSPRVEPDNLAGCKIRRSKIVRVNLLPKKICFFIASKKICSKVSSVKEQSQPRRKTQKRNCRMQKSVFSLFVSIVSVAVIQNSKADLIDAWDFYNLPATTATTATPATIAATVGTGTLDVSSFGLGSPQGTNPQRTSFSGTQTNTFTGSVDTTGSGTALALANSSANGDSIIFSFSTLGYDDLVVTFAGRGTSTGFNSGIWSWSTDGVNYTTLAGVNTATTSTTFAILTANFSGATGLYNANTAYLEYTLSGATSATGNNRLDNIQFNAGVIAVPEPSSIALAAVGGVACLLAFRRRN
jgi:hypothetical protein